MRWIIVPLAVLLIVAPRPAPAQRAPAGRPDAVMPDRFPDAFPDRSDLLDTVEAERRQAIRGAQAEAESASRAADAQATEARLGVEAAYERDAFGHWHRRGEIIVATSVPGAADAAQALGLSLKRGERLPATGLTLYTFAVPAGGRTQAAFEALKAARPDDAVDLNFVYEFEAVQGRGATAEPPPVRRPAGPRTAAVIDSSLPLTLPGVALRTARFGPGRGRVSAHALAVATVLADTAGREGLTLLAADVSEAGPLPGASAAAIAQALDWAVGAGARVVNVSLTGPPNTVLAAVVRRVAAKGVLIVAAAGNAGPRAPAPYPAALPDVIGVTAVDGRQRIWRRATQGAHVDFAAAGVKVHAAGGEWTGTSLAAPVVAGMLLRTQATPEALSRQARDLGAPGRDPVFGFGFVSGS